MKQILSLALFLFLFSCSSDELAGLDSEIDVEKHRFSIGTCQTVQKRQKPGLSIVLPLLWLKILLRKVSISLR